MSSYKETPLACNWCGTRATLVLPNEQQQL
ncbi:hypothetical protein A2U01_0047365, partial [Trifolium medium]|nr:hypothetical protein [Trifolium medium]